MKIWNLSPISMIRWYNHLARRDIEFFVDYSKKAGGKYWN